MPSTKQPSDDVEELEQKHKTLRGMESLPEQAEEEVRKVREDQKNGKGLELQAQLDRIEKKIREGSRLVFRSESRKQLT